MPGVHAVQQRAAAPCQGQGLCAGVAELQQLLGQVLQNGALPWQRAATGYG